MNKPLQDQPARTTITQDLDRNLTVLAGAGAGKTHALIERMVGIVSTGRVNVDRMAAITFTRKAAGEMRGRFFLRLREQAATATGEEATHIRNALDRIDQCFIGTIHSFCGQLLRERPVEAGLPPDFTEIEDREETHLRREAWDRFIQQGFVNDDPRLDHLDHIGLRTENLYAYFERRCLFSDVPLKPTAIEAPNLEPALEKTLAFLQDAEAHIPNPLPDRQDDLMKILSAARKFLGYRDLSENANRIELFNLFCSKPGKRAVTLKCWDPNQDAAKSLRDEYLPHLQDEILSPVLTRWRQHVYTPIATLVEDAVSFYETRRHTDGNLTFQDLLLKAAALLREHPRIRQYFQDRYRCLFVDEFQDTDPVQAEMLLYLTGEDTSESNWRALSPKPGSLFLVGDEKQSIYRFRRADVQTFRLARTRIETAGGTTLQLNTSFRSLGRLCDWINTTFEPLFAQHEERHQALFAPLFKFHPNGADPHGVRRISIEKISRNNRAQIVAQDAERIADFIATAIAGHTEFNSNAENAILPLQASPGDFMILTRTTSYLNAYARALEKRGIPYDISGGGRLGNATEISALLDLLETVHAPDNPLPFLGYLRGPFVGLGDDELYTFRRAGGVFNYRSPLPENLPEDLHTTLTHALERLARASEFLGKNTPATALEFILEDLGLPAFAASQPMGSSRAGNLLRLLALVRQWESQGLHRGQVLTELRDLVYDPAYKVEETTLEAGRENVVRLMNLHQAKGLQARVVFLADPADTSADRFGVDFHVSRTGDTPFLSMPVLKPKGPYAHECIAEPEGWAEDAEEETRFSSAEDLRLLYVAATRACNLLIVSCYNATPDKGPWALLYPALETVPELPVVTAIPPGQAQGPAPTKPESPTPDLQAAREDRARKWETVRVFTYHVRPVTTEDKDRPVFPTEGHGRTYGTLIHTLFDAAITNRLPENERAYIDALMVNTDLDPTL
ncbi:MAG: UvrD-helicase domain-containing protein, partial [bacterium]|nr:UvrD-helicase domain-containing protein [bacterium]